MPKAVPKAALHVVYTAIGLVTTKKDVPTVLDRF